VKCKKLKTMIFDDPKLTEHYKTFEGTYMHKSPNLHDDAFLVHIYFGSKVCIERIVKIMDELSMPDESVVIHLR